MTEIDDLIDGEKLVGGILLRPFTMGSQAACKQMRLSMFTDGETPSSEEEANRQIMAFAWLHSAPLPKVLQALRNGTADQEVELFGFKVEPATMRKLIEEINRISKRAAENSVDVIPRNGSITEDAPGNSVGQGI